MYRHPVLRGGGYAPLIFIVGLLTTTDLRASDEPATADLIRRIESLEQQMREKDRRIEELEQRVTAPAEARPPGRDAAREALEEALDRLDREQTRSAAERGPSLFSTPVGGANLRLIDISMDVLFAAGTSTERDEELQNLQGGGHDPRKRGFTMQNTELSFAGAVDPYLYGEAHLILFIDPIEGETIVELEEAFFQTQTLPAGLQIEAGQMFTEFGLINPQHPHRWDWLDQPVINSRVLGADGLRQTGARLGWLTPLPWYSEVHVGIQNANGETTASFLANDEFFEERAIGGRPFVERDVRSGEDMLYLARWVNGWDLGEEWSIQLGGSALFGPNATGADAQTHIFGGDLLVKWRPAANEQGWPFVKWQSEVIYRDYEAAAGLHPGPDGEFDTGDEVALSADDLRDWGFYTQLLYGFRRNWAAGLRYEFATGDGDSVDEGGAFVSHNDDPFRDERHRLSPLLVWQPTHFSRFRLQYNYDVAGHLDHGDAHSIWFGVEFLFGAHPAHGF